MRDKNFDKIMGRIDSEVATLYRKIDDQQQLIDTLKQRVELQSAGLAALADKHAALRDSSRLLRYREKAIAGEVPDEFYPAEVLSHLMAHLRVDVRKVAPQVQYRTQLINVTK